MKWLVLVLLVVGCGSESEITKEYYPVFAPSGETQVCTQQVVGCEEVVLRLIENDRIKRKRWQSAVQICSEVEL